MDLRDAHVLGSRGSIFSELRMKNKYYLMDRVVVRLELCEMMFPITRPSSFERARYCIFLCIPIDNSSLHDGLSSDDFRYEVQEH